MKNLRFGALLFPLPLLFACGEQVVGWDEPAQNTDHSAPRVSSTAPADGDEDVAINAPISVTFSEQIDAATITSESFFLRQGSTPVEAVVSSIGITALFSPHVYLEQNQEYTATLTTDVRDLAGNALSEDFTWEFTTGTRIDTIAPQVTATNPENNAEGVTANSSILCAFSEVMDPITFTSDTFTLYQGGTEIVGSIVQTGTLAIFNPEDDLLPGLEYTATVTDQAADLAGNTLNEDYVWTFTIGEDIDDGAPVVSYISPADEAFDVPVTTVMNVAFSEPMDPATISTATFTVHQGANLIPGTVTRSGSVAAFYPDEQLDQLLEYTVRITDDVTDLAGNPLAHDEVWTFWTSPFEVPVDLYSLENFAVVAGAGLTNSSSSGTTTITGHVGLYPTATCTSDDAPCAVNNPVINGTMYANDAEGVAHQAKDDLTDAFVYAMGRPSTGAVNDISDLTLTPGVYSSGSAMNVATFGTLTLDADGDPDAVWIFQVGSSLTINDDAQILLVNGAQAENVFWVVDASATIGSNVILQGSVLAGESITVDTESVVVGRLLCRTGTLTLRSNAVSLPTP